MSHVYYDSFSLDMPYYADPPFRIYPASTEQLLEHPPSEGAKSELRRLAIAVSLPNYCITHEREEAIALYSAIIALEENRDDDVLKIMCKVAGRVNNLIIHFYALEDDNTTRIAYLKHFIEVTYPFHYTLRATLAM